MENKLNIPKKPDQVNPTQDTADGRFVACKVFAQGHADPPQDCDMPFCGCNPAWQEAIEALVECGWGDLSRAQLVCKTQAEDPGLWFIAKTAPEAYLQQELRRLHEIIEGKAGDEIARELIRKYQL